MAKISVGKKMKLTERKLRKIIREAIVHKHLLNEDPTRNISTVGDLKALIKAATSKKKGEQGKAAFKDMSKDVFADLVPGGSTVRGLFGAIKGMYSLPDEKRTGTALDYMDVDDDVSAIVDDPIENAFIKAVSDKIEGMPDDTELKNLDMTKLLSQYIASEFNKRTVSGFK